LSNYQSNTLPEIARVEDLARILKVSKKSIHRWTLDPIDPLPCAKLAPGTKTGRVFFFRDHVLSWLQSKVRKPAISNGSPTTRRRRRAAGK